MKIDIIIFLILISISLYLRGNSKDMYIPTGSLSSRKTIYMDINARLGNQLFIHAFGHTLSRVHDVNIVFIGGDPSCRGNIFSHFTFDDKPNLEGVTKYKEPTEKCLTYMPELLKTEIPIALYGYFQNEKYFIDYKDEIIRLFTDNDVYKKLELKDKDKLDGCYLIHVRRGDYLTNNLHGINLDKYYKTAIEYITSRDSNAKFCIMSDDIEYCKSYDAFKNINKIFYDNKNHVESLYAMSLCSKGAICPNSTFSWWGSYLNKNPNKVVIFPNKWFNSDYPVDIYYKNSIVLPI